MLSHITRDRAKALAFGFRERSPQPSVVFPEITGLRRKLTETSDYATFLGNKGTALEKLGKMDEANGHYAEATYFSR